MQGFDFAGSTGRLFTAQPAESRPSRQAPPQWRCHHPWGGHVNGCAANLPIAGLVPW